MTLVRWKPARSLFPLSGIGDFDSAVSDFFSRPFGFFRELDFGWSPRVDVTESETAYELHAELPGIKKKEIEVSFQDDILTISGEKKHEEKKEDRENTYYHRESGYGSFKRSFRFTQPVFDENISAKYKDGILTITVPKAEVPEPQKVEIR